jgi:orotidine-5'-phosphate decarboxylase
MMPPPRAVVAAELAMSFVATLHRKLRAGMSPAVVGLDPRVESLPALLAAEAAPAARILAFYAEVLPALAAIVPAVKPNVAFFERWGAEGYAAFEQTCRRARGLGLLVIADVKRGDIGATAEAYAEAHYAHADAITLNPLLGSDSVAPYLAHCKAGRALFVLVRTSNPSAAEFQGLELARGGDLSAALASAVDAWGRDLDEDEGYCSVGAVVGATQPGELARLRRLMPRAIILVPGVGAQGARAGDAAAAFDARGRGGLVNQSRGILQCFAPSDRDWLDRVRSAARAFARDVSAASAGAGQASAP